MLTTLDHAITREKLLQYASVCICSLDDALVNITQLLKELLKLRLAIEIIYLGLITAENRATCQCFEDSSRWFIADVEGSYCTVIIPRVLCL